MTALGKLALAIVLLLVPGLASASCLPIAQRHAGPLQLANFRLAAAPAADHVRISFLGHASFLIESPDDVNIITDYSGHVSPPRLPDIVTMNNSHATHFTDRVAGIPHPLKGWSEDGKPVRHNLKFKDTRVFNVQTNARDWSGGTRYNGNSIFVYEVASLCIAHLGHLHHVLTDVHLGELGQVDILMIPVDGAFTMGQNDMMEVLEQIKAPLVLPMHYFSPVTLTRFLDRVRPTHKVSMRDTAQFVLSRAELPWKPEVWVLPGY